MNRTQTLTAKLTRRAGFAVALAATAVALVAPASGFAAAPIQFGAKLDSSTDPANSLPAHPCQEMFLQHSCTLVENEARYRPDGGERAPRSGTIEKIRLVAGGPGIFQLEIAQVKRSTLFGSNEARVVRKGPVIRYRGQTEANFEAGEFKVESFNVKVPVQKGQYLAILTTSTSMLYCAGGGDNILSYTPPLPRAGSFRPATSTDGCDLLLGATIK
jgi:hypothetical protein